MKQEPTESWIRKIEKILHNAFEDGRRLLFEYEVYEALAEMQISTPTYIIVRDERDITHSTLSVFSSTRIVLKVISEEVAHKQKSGGVRIVYRDLDFVKYSVREMVSWFAEHDRKIRGILLVEYIDYSKDLGNEILLGFRESQAFGPVISFSKGGTDAEHFAAN
ncbi:MAG TPA: acetate--CoA ligase family protein, partial [Spirochaetia bacterium]|nr:acetate--CoA ligase family protein [Spirochaetia bacterium]